MTATRIAGAATLAVVAAIGVVLALLLWRTGVPSGLRLPHVDERAAFGPELVRRARRHERLLDWDRAAAALVALAAYALAARRGRRLAPRLGLGSVNAGIVLGVVTSALVWAATLPFALAAAWWERRHGVSRESYAAAAAASWGGLLATTAVVLLILALVLGLAQRLGRRWWIAATPALTAILLVWQLAAPVIETAGTSPLHSRRLVAATRVLEQREHAGRPAVRVEAVAGRTRAANAYSTGIGPSERIVLWDTLLAGFSFAEVRFVVAHELAHLRRDHALRAVGWFAVLALPVLLVTACVADVRRPEAVPLAMLVVAVAQLTLLPVRNTISRRYEAEADWIALGATRDPAAAVRAFRGFVARSLEDPSPPGWVHAFVDDHPTPLQRVEMVRAWRLRNR